MLKIYSTCVALLLLTGLQAQNMQLSNSLIQRYHLHVDEHQQNGRTDHHRGACLTPLLVEVQRNWKQLSVEAKDIFRVYQSRPALTNEQVLSTDYFEIHYTTTGADGVDPTDADGNDVPDYVDRMADVADNVFVIDIDQRGFTPPPPDNGDGGNDRYDIYIFDLGSNTYGFVQPEVVIEDNPNSADITEVSAMTSYMAMQPNYDGFPNTEDENVKVTLAHELSHSIDFGYSNSYTIYFLEGKGAWEEQRIYPDLTDNFQYLTSFQQPDYALDWGDLGNETDDAEQNGRWYSAWLFFKSVSDYAKTVDPNETIVKDFLTRGIGSDEDNSFLDEELKANWNSSFVEEHIKFRIKNALFTDIVGYEPFVYAKSDSYREYLGLQADFTLDFAIENSIQYDGTAKVQYNSETDGNGRLMRLSADNISLTLAESVTSFQIQLTANEIADMDVYLIKENYTNSTIEIMESNDAYIIKVDDAADFEFFHIAVIRDDPQEQGATNEQYIIEIGDLVVNSAPSVASQSFSIDENAANGTSVGSVAATDADGNTLTYTFDGVPSDAPFTIDGSTGEITVADSDQLNFELIETFNYTVMVSDGAETSSAGITINLNDVDECTGDVTYSFDVNNSQEDGATGSITLSDIVGLTEPITYTWNNGVEGSSISDLAPGDYTVTMLDVNLCFIEVTFTVSTILGLEDTETVSFYPNPASDFLIINGEGRKTQKVVISSIDGKALYKKADYTFGTKLKINLRPGLYLLHLNNKVTKIIIQ